VGKAGAPPSWQHIIAGKMPALRWSVPNDQCSVGSCQVPAFCPLITDRTVVRTRHGYAHQ